jgi:putative ABC transport system permease protein
MAYLLPSPTKKAMLKLNFLLAFRKIVRHKFYSLLSLIGLSLGIAAFAFISIYLQDELTYDHYHSKSKRIYRLVFDNYLDLGSFATTPLPVGPAIASDLAQVEAMTRVSQGFRSLVRKGENEFFETIAFVDSGLFEVFDLQLIHGDAATCLTKPNQAIISASYAHKYFGEDNPIGQTLEIGSSGSLNSVVSGVFADLPGNSTLQLDFALPFLTFEKVWGPADLWRQMPANYTYVALTPEAHPDKVIELLPDFAKRHMAQQIDDWSEQYRLNLEPLHDIHLRSAYGRQNTAGMGDMASIRIFGGIALLILLIACINYINSATARFGQRIREHGIRKVIGASRRQLIASSMLETFALCLLSGLLAVGIMQVLLPVFNEVSGKAFDHSDLLSPGFGIFLFVIILMVSLLSGLIPAIFFSSFRPQDAVMGRMGKVHFADRSRKALIVTQFASSAVLIVATITIYGQMNYIRDSLRPGDDTQVAVFPINDEIHERYDLLNNRLSNVPGVISISAASNVPSFYGDSWPVSISADGEGAVQMENFAIEEDFIETMGYELVAGRPLTRERATDVSSGYLLNERAVKMLEFETPDDALGTTLYWGGENKKRGQVVGVLRDFHFASLKNEIEPALVQFSPREWMTNNFVVLRIRPQDYGQIYRAVAAEVDRIDASWALDLKFLDDNFLAFHQRDMQQGRLVASFSILAILLSCLGLAGLSVFAAEQRKKELGVRKILGASVSQLATLLSNEFTRLVLVGLLMAIPLSWWILREWLDNFAYRIDFPVWSIPVTAVVIMIIAYMAIGYQSLLAARRNPVHALRQE